jgi:membrane protein
MLDDCLQKAAGLSFDTIFAIVPLAAIAVSLLKLAGVYENIERGSLRFWLEHTVGVRSQERLVTLVDVINEILDTVADADLSRVGAIGAVALLYAIAILFNSVESSLDAVFGTEESRPLRQRLVNYAALLFAMPMLVVAASVPLAAIIARLSNSGFVDALIHAGSTLAAGVALTVAFRLGPNVRVGWLAAVAGGLVGGVVGYAALQAQVQAQVGVARYNLLYSSLAALPLVLLWVYVSWLAVLFGAEIAALLNDPVAYAWRVDHRRPSHADRQRVALWITRELVRARLAGTEPADPEDLFRATGVPAAFGREVLAALEAGNLIVRVGDRRELVQLSGDADHTTAADVLRVVLHDGTDQSTFDRKVPEVESILERVEVAVDEGTAEIPLTHLVTEGRDTPS